MRLLNTTTLKFREFFDSEDPKYLILSHRWGKDEVSYQQMESGNVPDGEGIAKIRRFCQLVAQKGTEWCWVDTCCIDKKSSAELTEAINSMYRWYSNAQECIVYLRDVQKWNHARGIQKSEWFTRGWTVQELLAPRLATFFDREWSQLGTRMELLYDIVVAAHIDTASVEEGIWSQQSVARKMSWFAHRQTSRIEDLAYSMLGIFNINMPLIYGEGSNAFRRLQIEIVNSTDDESIFAWDPWKSNIPAGITHAYEVWKGGDRPRTGRSRNEISMLAPHPMCFTDCGSIRKLSHPFISKRPPYTATNKSLQISVLSIDTFASLFDVPVPEDILSVGRNLVDSPCSLLRLNCGAEDHVPVVIVLVHKEFDPNQPMYRHVEPDSHLEGWYRFMDRPFKIPDSLNIGEGNINGDRYETLFVGI